MFFHLLVLSTEVGSFLKIDENQNEELDEHHMCLTNPRSSLAEETQYVLFLARFVDSWVLTLFCIINVFIFFTGSNPQILIT